MNIFSNMFSPKPAAPAADAPAPNTPPAPGATPDGKIPGTDQHPVNPMDAYAKLWDTTATDTSTPPAFSIDPTTLDKVSGSLNFTQNVAPELMQKATSGDMAALMQIMNQVGQQAYKASISHNSALTDKFVAARSQYDFKNIGSTVKQEMTSTALQTSVPNASHPVVKQELRRIADAMQKQNPDASPQDIADSAKKYFNELYSAVNPGQTQQEQQAATGEQDWDKYFG